MLPALQIRIIYDVRHIPEGNEVRQQRRGAKKQK
jgi:hypothetical protein